VEEFAVKGFAMDDERLKNLGKKYFEEQLQRIRSSHKEILCDSTK
jgi:hypothetical protein